MYGKHFKITITLELPNRFQNFFRFKNDDDLLLSNIKTKTKLCGGTIPRDHRLYCPILCFLTIDPGVLYSLYPDKVVNLTPQVFNSEANFETAQKSRQKFLLVATTFFSNL